MEATMRKIIMALLAGYVGLFASTADAGSLTLTRKTVDNGWEKARMNCDQFGRCWKEGSRNALLDSYNYAPPPRGRNLKPQGSVPIEPRD
jgi:hypothetical protein